MLTSTQCSSSPKFFDVFLDLAEEFRLPLRLPDAGAQRLAGFPFRALALERGVVSPDRVILGSSGARNGHPAGLQAAHEEVLAGQDADSGAEMELASLLSDLEPGVTELCLRPARDTVELRAAAPDWQARTTDYRLLVKGGALSEAMRANEVKPLDYRALRELMRAP